MNLNDTYWSERITVRQQLVGEWMLGRDPSNSYTAKSFLLFKPDGKCCTMTIIREGDAMLLHSSIRAAIDAVRAEGFKAGQEAMRERAAARCHDRGGFDAEAYDAFERGHEHACRHCREDIRALPIEAQ